MKIAIVRPRYKSHLVTPPLGMGYISSYMKAEGHEVTFIDGLRDDLSDAEIVERCADVRLVGISCLSDYAHETYALSRALVAEDKLVCIGGPHPTALPRQTLTESHAQYVVVGEGELAFADLLRHLDAGGDPFPDMPGVGHSKTEHFFKRPFVGALDEIPFPDWESMPPASYPRAPHGGLVKHFPIGVVTSTRGCPYGCTFCSSPQFWDRRFNKRSPENVVAEIEMLVRDYGVKEIHFEDDNLTLDRPHIEGICNLLIEREVGVAWSCPNGVRADRVDEPLLRLMRQAGCYSLAFGIESGNQQILDNVDKAGRLDSMEESITIASKLGYITQGFFIFGLPGETPRTVRETIDFAKRLPLTKAQFLLFDVFPGCDLWDELQGEFTVDFGRESYHEVTWVPASIDATTLANAQGQAFREFFLRPRSIWYVLRNLKLSQLGWIWKRIRDFKVLSLKTGDKVQEYDALYRPEDGRRAARNAELRKQRETAALIPEAEWQAYVERAGEAVSRDVEMVTAGAEPYLDREELVERNRDALI